MSNIYDEIRKIDAENRKITIEQIKEDINAKSVGIINYLIYMYSSTEFSEYSMYPTKTRKLINIYMLCISKYSSYLFSSEHPYSGVFEVSEDGNVVFDSMYLMGTNNKDTYLLPEDCCEIKEHIEPYDNKKCYILTGPYDISISDFSKKLLELIFRKFGNYNFSVLSEFWNEIRLKLLEIENLEGNWFNSKFNLEKFIEDNENLKEKNMVFRFIDDFNKKELCKLKYIDYSYPVILSEFEKEQIRFAEKYYLNEREYYNKENNCDKEDKSKTQSKILKNVKF